MISLICEDYNLDDLKEAKCIIVVAGSRGVIVEGTIRETDQWVLGLAR